MKRQPNQSPSMFSKPRAWAIATIALLPFSFTACAASRPAPSVPSVQQEGSNPSVSAPDANTASSIASLHETSSPPVSDAPPSTAKSGKITTGIQMSIPDADNGSPYGSFSAATMSKPRTGPADCENFPSSDTLRARPSVLSLEGTKVVFSGQSVCQAESKSDALKCWNTDSGKETLNKPARQSNGRAWLRELEDGQLEHAFKKGGHLRIARGFPQTGVNEVFRTELPLPTSKRRYFTLLPIVKNNVFAVHTDRDTNKSTVFRVSLHAPTSVESITLPLTTRRGTRFLAENSLIIARENAGMIRAFSFAGKVLWKKKVRGFLRNVTLHNGDVYYEDNTYLRRLNGKTGALKRKVPMDTQTNQGHVWGGDLLYSSDKLGLRVFDSSLNIVSRRKKLPQWMLNRKVIRGKLVLWNSEHAYAFDARNLANSVHFEVSGESLRDASWNTDGIRYRTHPAERKSLDRIYSRIRVIGGTLDLGEVLADTIVTHEGQIVSTGYTLPPGESTLFAIRLGKRVEALKIKIEACKTTKVRVPKSRSLPVPVTEGGQRKLPPWAGDSMTREYKKYKLGTRIDRKTALLGRQVVGLSKSRGLVVSDVTTGQVNELSSQDQLAEDIRKGLSKELKSKRFAKLEIFSVIPEHGLAILRPSSNRRLLGAYSIGERRIVWTTETTQPLDSSAGLTEHVGLIWSSASARLVALDPFTGAEVYRLQVGIGNQELRQKVHIAAQRAFVIVYDDAVGIDLESGKTLWKRESGHHPKIWMSPNKDRIYVRSTKHITVYDLDGKRLAQSSRIPGKVGELSFTEDGLLLACSRYRPFTRALDPQSLHKRWDTEKTHYGHPCISETSKTEGFAFDKNAAFIFALKNGKLTDVQTKTPSRPRFIVEGDKRLCVVGRNESFCYDKAPDLSRILFDK